MNILRPVIKLVEKLFNKLYQFTYWYDRIKIELAKRSWKAERRQRFYQKLGSLLSSGASIKQALSSLKRRNAQESSLFSPHFHALSQCMAKLRQGGLLSEALQGWAPEQEIHVLRAGEEAGDLPRTLQFASELIEGRERLRKAIVNALAYPAVLIVGVFGLFYFVGTALVPRMAALGDPAQWTGHAYILYAATNWMQSYYASAIPLGGLILFGLILYSLPRTLLPHWIRRKLDRYPPWSFYRLFVGSTFLLNLSSLLKAGMSQQDALRNMREGASPYLKYRIEGILAALRRGADNIGEAMDWAGYDFPDRDVIEDLMTYANLPNFGGELRRLGTDWMESGIEKVERQAQFLNWVLIIGIGMGIAWTAWAIFSMQQFFMNNLQM